MNIRKDHRKDQSNQTDTLNETTWNKEKRTLRKLSRLLFYDIQKVESLFCLDIKNKVDFSDEVRRFEINLIKTALLQAGGSQRRSAELLGISAATLNSKIKHHNIAVGSRAENTI